MSAKRHPAALWGIGVATALVLYLSAGWFMWRAAEYIPAYLTPGSASFRFALDLSFNDYVGVYSPIWKPAYALFECCTHSNLNTDPVF